MFLVCRYMQNWTKLRHPFWDGGSRKLARLQKKLEELEKEISNPSSGIDKIMESVVSPTSHEQNVCNTVAGAASLDSQVSVSNNSVDFQTMSTAVTAGSIRTSEVLLAEASNELMPI